MLQELRKWALTVDKKRMVLACHSDCERCAYCKLNIAITPEQKQKVTTFYEFIDHSDMVGGYISFKEMGITLFNPAKFREDKAWGDLDRLKEEVTLLDAQVHTIPFGLKDAWDDFKTDVEQAQRVLLFN